MSTQANKDLVKRFFAGINAHKVDEIDRVMDRQLVWHGTHDFGLKVYRQDLLGVFAAFADAQWTIHDLIAEGDQVVVRWTFHGTQTGDWENLAKSGRKVSYGGISICRIDEIKIVEVWNNENLLGLFRQLGCELSPPK
ncbi:MAG: ester cyclase [Anaerolineae bacterium]|nr:ester cyclase [Anaerolineae bacterium]